MANFVSAFLDSDINAIMTMIENEKSKGESCLKAFLNGDEPLLSIVCKSKNTNVPEEVRLVVLQILLANGADPNQLDRNGLCPLSIALGSGFADLGKALLEAGADANGSASLSRAGLAPIHATSRVNCAKGLQLLLDRGVDVDTPRADGVTALLLSVCVNSCECAEMLVHAGANVEISNKEGHSPLLAACYEANPRTFELLISAGANVRKRKEPGQRNYSPLMAVCDSSRTEWANPTRLHIAKCLVGMGVPIDHQGSDGASAVALAAFHGFTDVVTFLLEQGASVSLVSNNIRGKHPYGVCALQFASQAGHKEVVRLLLFAGADPDHKDNEGTTPLIAATRNQRWEIADMLIAAGASVTHRNARQECPARYLQRRPGPTTPAAPANNAPPPANTTGRPQQTPAAAPEPFSGQERPNG